MSISAFGVDHGGEIAKRNYTPPNQEPQYRGGIGSGLNARSKTYVKRGTMAERTGRIVGGEIKGAAAGGALGAAGGAALGAITRKPGAVKLGALAGGGIGSGVGSGIGSNRGRSKNIKVGDTIAFNRRTGAKSQGKHLLGPALNNYGKPPTVNGM
jgi:hypothetical protein